MVSPMISPMQLYDIVNHHGLVEDIYKAMQNPDLAEPVMTALNILKKTKIVPSTVKDPKSETKSTQFRNAGNIAYSNNNHQQALILYNKALLYAPNSSRAMKLAYSNRSAIYHKANIFSACLNDLETCFNMGCPLDIIDKLKKRRDEAKTLLWTEKMVDNARLSIYDDKYFELNIKRNPQIPSASTDVGVIMEGQVPKVIATTDVKVGVILAVETAFATDSDAENAQFSCYYCNKMNLNLKPCDSCCVALFCSEECRGKCLKEYHSVECHFINFLYGITSGVGKLALKSFLKMRYLCKTWKELISASHKYGIERIKSSSINEIFDMNYKFSLLNMKGERYFKHGPLFNNSFTCAFILNCLERVPGFFPELESDRYIAMRASSRILLFLTQYSQPTQIFSPVVVADEEKVVRHETPDYGLFSFCGKLRHVCKPNALIIGLNNRVAVMAIAPISKGDEITVSQINYWMDVSLEKRIRMQSAFKLCGVACSCTICTGDYISSDSKLSEVQKKHYKKLHHEIRTKSENNTSPKMIAKYCKMLALLSDVPFSEEYKHIYSLYKQCIIFLQDVACSNYVLDLDYLQA